MRFKWAFAPVPSLNDDLLIVHANLNDVHTHVFPPEEIKIKFDVWLVGVNSLRLVVQPRHAKEIAK